MEKAFRPKASNQLLPDKFTRWYEMVFPHFCDHPMIKR